MSCLVLTDHGTTLENELKDNLQLFVGEPIDRSTSLQMTERMSEQVFPKMKDQMKPHLL